jgi:nucleotide-binding universal stress UspA family protein
VLVGVDGSPGSSATLGYAASEARRRDTGLRLVHVVPDYAAMSPMLPMVPSELEATGRKILERAATEAADLVGRERVVTSLVRGSRVPSLVRAAEHAVVVVLGREDIRLVERLVTVATTIGVASRSARPTIAVPPGWAEPAETLPVVVGLKSTDHARGLLRRGFETAAGHGAPLVVVHAWELPSGYGDMIADRVGREEWHARLASQAEPHLAEWRAAFPDVRVELRIVHGQPARVLQAATAGAGLLLVVRRLYGFPGGHLGGTGRTLLRSSACPVEVVPVGVVADLETAAPVHRGGALLT